LEHFGKLCYQQLTELCNCNMNRGLPSCLAGSEPSINYHIKGLDIHAAAYCAELGFLANPMSTHVQCAEMNNQAVNSMALASTRKTIEAAEVLSLLMASHLYICCQAIDLRVADAIFRSSLAHSIGRLMGKHFTPLGMQPQVIETLTAAVREKMFRRLEQTASMDSKPRMEDLASIAVPLIVESLTESSSSNPLQAIAAWKLDLVSTALEARHKALDEVIGGRVDVTSYLGSTKEIYEFVRRRCGVAFRRGDVYDGRSGSTIGRSVSSIVDGLSTFTGRRSLDVTIGAVEC